MKIKEITYTLEKIPLKTPFKTALRTVNDVEFVRLRVLCDDGNISYGEAPATKAITGEDLESLSDAIDKNGAKFLGLDVDDAVKKVHTLEIGSSAKAMFDMAFYVLLHPEYKNTSKIIKTAITISLNNKEKMLFDAIDAMKNSNNILKLKFGSDINHAVDVTKEVALQSGAKILVDANQSWSLEDTKEYINAIQEIDIQLIEQPVKGDDIKSLREITYYSKVPIVADESCFSLDDVKKVVSSKSADIINIKLMKCGGITKAIEILEYCKEMGVDVMMGSMLEGPTSINYAQHLVNGYSDVIKYVDLDSPLLYANNHF